MLHMVYDRQYETDMAFILPLLGSALDNTSVFTFYPLVSKQSRQCHGNSIYVHTRFGLFFRLRDTISCRF